MYSVHLLEDNTILTLLTPLLSDGINTQKTIYQAAFTNYIFPTNFPIFSVMLPHVSHTIDQVTC